MGDHNGELHSLNTHIVKRLPLFTDFSKKKGLNILYLLEKKGYLHINWQDAHKASTIADNKEVTE